MQISNDAKRAILNCLTHAAWSSDNAETYYNALASAFFPLTSITAVYTQSGTVTDATPLDNLKTDLVVTANYESGETETVPSADYTLSGTLTAGTSTVTVSYAGKTTTFNVTVTAAGKSDMNGWTDNVAYTDLEIIENRYINYDGVRAKYNGWNCTGYVPCDGCSTLEFVNSALGSDWNCFYDQNQQKLQSAIMIATGHQTITVPSGAYYFSISETAAKLATTITNGIIPHE